MYLLILIIIILIYCYFYKKEHFKKIDTIDFIEISTLGNSADFGDPFFHPNSRATCTQIP